MKKTRLFIGLVALIALVSMNMRHAWMNYGIAEKRVLAWVMADSLPSVGDSSVVCETKKGFDLTVNAKQESKDIKVRCEVGKRKIYYKRYSDGYERIIATEVYDYRHDTRTISPMDANLNEATRVVSEPICDEIVSPSYSCGDTNNGECCYAKSAEQNCSKLLSGITVL